MKTRSVALIVLAGILLMGSSVSAGIDLITMGSGETVGDFHVAVDGDSLGAIFETFGPWRMAKAQMELFVDDSAFTDIPVNNKGKPQPGKFEWTQNDLGFAQISGDTFSLSALGFQFGQRVCIALHVVVVQIDEKGKVVVQEDAWAVDFSEPLAFPDGVSSYVAYDIPSLPETLSMRVSLDLSSDPRLEGLVRIVDPNPTILLQKLPDGRYGGARSILILTADWNSIPQKAADIAFVPVFHDSYAVRGDFSFFVYPLDIDWPGHSTFVRLIISGAMPGPGFSETDPLEVGEMVLIVTIRSYEEWWP